MRSPDKRAVGLPASLAASPSNIVNKNNTHLTTPMLHYSTILSWDYPVSRSRVDAIYNLLLLSPYGIILTGIFLTTNSLQLPCSPV